MWSERLKVLAAIAGLIGIVAMLLGIAWSDRRIKRDMAEGREPKFSWAWFIFSVFLLSQGIRSVMNAWIYEKYVHSGFWVDFIWKALAALLLGVAIPNFINHIRWFVYSRRQQGE